MNSENDAFVVPSVKCLLSENNTISAVFKTRDYAVTNEAFSIFEVNETGFRFTSPVPSVETMNKYYDAETYISHSKTSESFMDKLFHLARFYTLGMKRRVVNFNYIGKEKKILDLGCGSGDFAGKMKDSGWDVTGVEPSDKARIFAAGEHGLDVFKTLTEIPSDTRFPVITAWHVLEHIPNLEECLNNLYNRLTDDGVLIVALPNFTSFDAEFYKDVWAGYDVPRHLYHFSPRSITSLAETHGFKLRQTRRMWLDAFYVSLLSESYMKTGFAGYPGAFFVGLWSNFIALFKKEKCSSLIYVFSKR
jgi:2-polyprenyl-3-methyl-5-hydroxy-6-metoxy-1,4-benzoquinol methylase